MLCAVNGTALQSVLPPLLFSGFILGAVGNGFALWIFFFHLKPWKSSTVLLFNLAMADFLLIMVLPLRATYYISNLEWNFGKPFCNIILFMFAMNRTGSTLFLMAIAVDRYIRVVHPHHPINFLNVSKAMCGAAALWLLAISMCAHIFAIKHTDTTTCESFMFDSEHYSHLTWHNFVFLFSFLVPLLVILYCTVKILVHLRGRQLAQQAKIKKALFFIVVVVVLFIICFLPSNVTQLIVWYKMNKAISSALPKNEVCATMEHLIAVFYMTLSFTYLNSILDPVVYYFSSPAVKNICRTVLRLPQASETAESPEKKAGDSGSQSHSQL